MDKPIGLMIVVALLAFFLKLEWLAMVMIIGILLILVASIELRRPSPVPAGGRKEEILTPVVVQDLGEPPYLYPPNFELKYNPNESLMPLYDIAGQSLGSLVRFFVRAARGDPQAYRSGKGKVGRKVKWR
ncbi:hypothetical protein K8R43_04095 [archaeon]|nr:hypothetical protein [archaeon]